MVLVDEALCVEVTSDRSASWLWAEVAGVRLIWLVLFRGGV